MSQSTLAAVLGATGTVIAAVFAFYGVRYTVRWATKAQATNVTSVAQEALLSTIDALTKDVAGVRKAQAEDRQVHRKEIGELRTRVDAMEIQRTALSAYIRRLLRLIREDGRLVIPPFLAGMNFDDED